MTEKPAVGLRLKAARKQERLTQKQVAKRAGLTRSYVSLVESGTRAPSEAAIKLLSAAVNLPEHILKGSGDIASLAPPVQHPSRPTWWEDAMTDPNFRRAWRWVGIVWLARADDDRWKQLCLFLKSQVGPRGNPPRPSRKKPRRKKRAVTRAVTATDEEGKKP